jgi:hypothetical protein
MRATPVPVKLSVARSPGSTDRCAFDALCSDEPFVNHVPVYVISGAGSS